MQYLITNIIMKTQSVRWESLVSLCVCVCAVYTYIHVCVCVLYVCVREPCISVYAGFHTEVGVPWDSLPPRIS